MTTFFFVQVYIYIEKILEVNTQYFWMASLEDNFACFLLITTF